MRTLIALVLLIFAISVIVTWAGYLVAVRTVGGGPSTLQDYGGSFGAIGALFGTSSSLLVCVTLYMQVKDAQDRARDTDRSITLVKQELNHQKSLCNIIAVNALATICKARYDKHQESVTDLVQQARQYRENLETRSGKRFLSDRPVDEGEAHLAEQLRAAQVARQLSADQLSALESKLKQLMDSLEVAERSSNKEGHI